MCGDVVLSNVILDICMPFCVHAVNNFRIGTQLVIPFDVSRYIVYILPCEQTLCQSVKRESVGAKVEILIRVKS